MIKQALQTYSRWLASFPYRTKMLTSGAMFAGGDFICQKLIEKQPSLNTDRLAKATTIGTFGLAPILHNWFGKVLPWWYKNVL